MLGTLFLDVQSVVSLCGGQKEYFERGSIIRTTREKLLQCNLSGPTLESVRSIPPNIVIKLRNINIGQFEILP